VAEACESDGTLVGYQPAIGVIHNVSRDHDELSALRPQFTAVRTQLRTAARRRRLPEAATLGKRFKAAHLRRDPGRRCGCVSHDVGPRRARACSGMRPRSDAGHPAARAPQPRERHRRRAVAIEIGLDADAVVGLLSRFPGVARRFELVGTTAGDIHVVDDYAHNGEKIRAAITTAQAGSARVVAVFQPHGFGPARFLRGEAQAMIPACSARKTASATPRSSMPRGTVAKDISSRMLADDLPAALNCGYAQDHEAARQWVVSAGSSWGHGAHHGRA